MAARKIYPFLDENALLGIRAGDDWNQVLTAYNETNGDPYDFSHHSAVLQIRDKAGALKLQASTAAGTLVLGGVTGTITIAVPKSLTADINPGIPYEYGLAITTPDLLTNTWLEGPCEVGKKLVY